ncbi:unnamed protein product [Urochloa decumbens]|uniref:Bifunctional inhibitor/plant lipid transfer protein/seed storage helical domain-containing protein n=1 Tax=Urochloa decumbens TaxID=240449 RepID=A0ABC8YJT7_9POAL
MASRRRLQMVTTLAVVVVTAATAMTLASAQQQVQPASAAEFFPPALPSCPPAPLSLSPCLGYVFGVGSATLTACCSQLRSFLRAQAPCLCAASKLPPNPVGLLLGQAQTIIPNVCDLPNPCDDAAAAGDGEGSAPVGVSTPSVEGAAPPSETATATPAATTTPATEEPTSSAPSAADPDASGASPEPAEDDSPAAATGPAGPGSKLPQLLHAAGATSSRGMAAGTAFATVFLASVAAMMYV